MLKPTQPTSPRPQFAIVNDTTRVAIAVFPSWERASEVWDAQSRGDREATHVEEWKGESA